MSTILKSLQRLLHLFENEQIPYMIIGGYALPFHGRIRATLDIDLAISVKTEKDLDRLCQRLQSTGFEVSLYSPQNPVMVIVDKKEKVEMELWLKPDGITFDHETLKRRIKAALNNNVQVWIVSPEDFIVNKLARPDRGAVDEQDVKSVLIRQKGKLDTKYLTKRAREAGVLKILQAIEAT